MNVFNKLFVSGLILSALFFSSCTSIPVADPSLDQAAKQFKPDPKKAVIYVYRNEFIGAAVSMDVLFDDQVLGKTRSGHFLRIVSSPGNHVVTSRAESSDTAHLKTEAGKIYYVWQEVKMGVMFASTKLNVVDAPTGQAGVNQCQLIQHPQPYEAKVSLH